MSYLPAPLAWLQRHRTINVLLIGAYFAFIVLMHHPLVLLSIWVEQHLGITGYNALVAGVFVVTVGTAVALLVKQLLNSTGQRGRPLFYLLGSLALLVIHSRFMFDSNIEVIHSFQYMLLVLLIFPLVQRFGGAILFTMPFMLVDEWYQYALLYPEFCDYFDLNDILMDTYGCGMAMAALMVYGTQARQPVPPVWQRAELVMLVTLVAFAIIAVQACFVAPYATDACPHTWLVLNERTTPEPFWRPHPTHHIYYHVMKPAEGLIAITALALFYLGMDRKD